MSREQWNRSSWLRAWLLLGIGLVVLPGSTAAQSTPDDLCGCAGLPSPGDFDLNDEDTWPDGTEAVGGVVTIPLPDDGVFVFDNMRLEYDGISKFNYILRFAPNATNTAVTLLVKSNLTFGGGTQIDVSGSRGQISSVSRGLGGLGGPGGFRGGDGANLEAGTGPDGGSGLGPGGGAGAQGSTPAAGGVFTGSAELLPLVGGSGGGGGSFSETCLYGGGGGGGGGAILIAVNGTIHFSSGGGTINARGARGGIYGFVECDGAYGSGGAIRLVAREVAGSGSLDALNEIGVESANGRIRLEAVEDDLAVSMSPPGERHRVPGVVSLPVTPRVRIASVAGASPDILQEPRGWSGEIDILVAQPGPVTVGIETAAVPGGTTVDVTAKPDVGSRPVEEESGLLGSCNASLCHADVTLNLEAGAYFLEARATYAVP